MEEFLEEIGIEQKGTMSPDGCLVVDFQDEEEWAKAESRLDRSDLVDLDDDSSMITYDVSTQQYVGDYYTVTLNADLENGIYKLIVKEN